MFHNYLITALRNLTQHKLYSFINIIGLSVGLACAILIVLFLRDELSYDRWIPGSSNLYRVEMTVHAPGRPEEKTTRTPIPLPPLMREQLPEVRAMTQIFPQGMTVTVGDRQFSETVLVVDPNFLQVIKLPLAKGDPARVFTQPESIVLSQSTAKKYFGEVDPIGKLVSVSGVSHGGVTPEFHTLTVTGVLRDLPDNTHLAAELVLPNTSKADQISQSDKENWWNLREFGYVALAPNTNPDQVIAKLVPIVDRTTNPMKDLGLNFRTSQLLELHLTPFNEVHLTSDNYGAFKPPGSWTIIYGFAAVALLILLVACFNFTNLATARATLRIREISLRKTVGATRQQLIVQFLGETLLMALIALVVALALVEILLPVYGRFLGKPITFHYLSDWRLLVSVATGSMVAGILSGVYPALVLSSFRPGGILSTSGSARMDGSGLRTLLVILQFAVSIGLGIAAIVVFGQIDYAHKLDVGLNRDGIIVIGADSLSTTARENFARTLSANPEVLGVAFSSQVLFSGSTSNGLAKLPGESQQVLVRTMDISPEFPNLYGMPLLAGRLLAADRGEDTLVTGVHVGMHEGGTNDGRNILMNVSAARRFGYTAEGAIGKVVILDNARLTVVGILADSKIDGLKVPVQAMIFGYYPMENAVISVRIRGGQMSDTLTFIDKTWRKFAPGFPVQRYFLSDVFESQFEADERRGTMFGLFVGIAISIACLGLFGLAAFTAQRRTKEIGVRKVFGARTADIVRLLLWQCSIPVLIANIIAWPIAYYYLRHWLENYAYRIALSPIYFVAAGAIALTIAWATVFTHALRVARASPIYALRYE